MASRKYLAIIAYPLIALSNPWIPKDGVYKYSSSIEKYNLPKYSRNELEQYKILERDKILLQNELNLLEVQNLLAQENARNDENKNRLEQYRQHRIFDFHRVIDNIKFIQSHLYLDYKLGGYNYEVEYGYGGNKSFGFSGNFTNSKYSSSKQFEIFSKYKLYDRRSKILTIKPYIFLYKEKVRPGAKMIFGSGKTIKPRRYFPQYDIFNYGIFGMEYGPYGYIYQLEYQAGVKLKYDIFFIVNSSKRLEKNPSKLYRHLLRKEYKIGKEFSSNGSKIGISLGYFSDISISAKRPLSNGCILGIWGEF